MCECDYDSTREGSIPTGRFSMTSKGMGVEMERERRGEGDFNIQERDVLGRSPTCPPSPPAQV